MNTFAVNTTLNKSHKLKDKILLEDYPSGEQYLIPAIEAIHNCITLEITYQSYWQDKSYTFQIEPYCIKAFKQRWYIAARSPYYNKVLIYSLERILEMEQTDLSFECPQTFNPKVYFDNSFGVIVDEEYDVEKIRIKVYGNQCKYFRSSRYTILKKKVKHIVTIPFSIIHYVLPMISVKLYYRMEIL